jgi:hypothetical protein
MPASRAFCAVGRLHASRDDSVDHVLEEAAYDGYANPYGARSRQPAAALVRSLHNRQLAGGRVIAQAAPRVGA